MSWHLSVPAMAKKDFADAVTSAEVIGPPEQAGSDQVLHAKEALRTLGATIDAEYIAGSASGHDPRPYATDGTYSGSESIGVTAYSAREPA